jgi:hypothetical protein
MSKRRGNACQSRSTSVDATVGRECPGRIPCARPSARARSEGPLIRPSFLLRPPWGESWLGSWKELELSRPTRVDFTRDDSINAACSATNSSYEGVIGNPGTAGVEHDQNQQPALEKPQVNRFSDWSSPNRSCVRGDPLTGHQLSRLNGFRAALRDQLLGLNVLLYILFEYPEFCGAIFLVSPSAGK